MSGEIGPILNEMSAFLLAQAERDGADSAKFWPMAAVLRQLADIVDDRAASCLAQAATIREIVEDTRRLMMPAASAGLAALVPPPPAAPEDFHARRLGEYLEGLNAALIAAHSWLETSDAVEAKPLICRIWEHLEPLAKRESRLIPHLW